MERKVKCPQCHAILMPPSNIGDGLITCPRCKFNAKLDLYLMGDVSGGGHGPGGVPPTRPQSDPPPPDSRKGYLRVAATGAVFPLKAGENVIGRIAESGTADIRISKDICLSRRHVIIEAVTKVGRTEYHLKDINSKNPIKLNGSVVGRENVVVLEAGDELILGKTAVYFELK
ncbi:MAG: FHA domain-containing protein [Prevotellaceae bacterium]|nr:FHA domain-containing protein [Prevotellaceae bacterium]